MKQHEIVDYLLKHDVKLEIRRDGYTRLVLNDSVVILFDPPYTSLWERITNKLITLSVRGWAAKEFLL